MIKNDIALKTAEEIDSLADQWRSKLACLDEATAHAKPNPVRWSISEVLGHLIDSACNNHQRFVRAQYCDSLEFPKYDQNQWVSAANYSQCDWETLVELWYFYNRQLAFLVRQIPTAAMSTPCTITPYETCTLEFLVIDYVTHLRHHFEILLERMEPSE